MKADTWQKQGAEAHALNELSFLRGFGIEGAYLLPRASSSYLPWLSGHRRLQLATGRDTTSGHIWLEPLGIITLGQGSVGWENR